MSAHSVRSFLAITSLALLAACANSSPGLKPPGTANGGAARFFFPTAMALSPDGKTLFVANSNFDLAFNAATIVRLTVDQVFVDPSTLSSNPDLKLGKSNSAGPTIEFPSSLVSVGVLDSFAGNMVYSLGPAGSGPAGSTQPRLYVTTRARAAVDVIPLDTKTGDISCVNADCRNFALLLDNVQDPYALQPAQLPLTNSGGALANVLLVSALGQAPTSENGVGQNTAVNVIPEPQQLPTAGTSIQTPFSSVNYSVNLGQPGSNSIAVGPNNEVIVGGCFVVVPGGSTVPCIANPDLSAFQRTNILRLFDGNAGPAAQTSTLALGSLLGTSTTGNAQTRALAVSTVDPMNPATATPKLFVATATPNTLLVTTVPTPGSGGEPTVLATVPLATSPGQMLKLPRPGAGDLLAITATESNSLLIVDPTLGAVVAQVQPIGAGPFGMAAFRTTVPPSKCSTEPEVPGTKLFVSLFNDCGVAQVNVPDGSPEAAYLFSTVGSCL